MRRTSVRPAGVGAPNGPKVEGLGRPHLTTRIAAPTDLVHSRPIYRACPQCRLQARAGEFAPVRAPRGVGGFAWRQCPRCGHVGTLAGFSRVDGDGQRVSAGRAVRR